MKICFINIFHTPHIFHTFHIIHMCCLIMSTTRIEWSWSMRGHGHVLAILEEDVLVLQGEDVVVPGGEDVLIL